MSKLTFEQRQRLETEVLPAVISDPEYAAATIVRLEAERDQWQQRCEKAWRVLDQEFGVRIASVYNGPLEDKT